MRAPRMFQSTAWVFGAVDVVARDVVEEERWPSPRPDALPEPGLEVVVGLVGVEGAERVADDGLDVGGEVRGGAAHADDARAGPDPSLPVEVRSRAGT